jgi:hypothetical protein
MKCEEGTPQGATVSPLLANIYLHYVLDLWAQRWRSRSARGDVIITRFADDFIVGFQYRSDAERFLRELTQRLQQFSLELHPEKTRLIEFGRFAARDRKQAKLGAPETFDFLGFTHACGTTEKGTFQVERRTMKKRMTAKLHELKLELQRRRHHPIPEQGRWLRQVVEGYFGYYGVPGNEKRLRSFRDQVKRLWLRALRRRSQRDKTNWERMGRLEARWIPPVRWRHPWPEARFDATIRDKNRMRYVASPVMWRASRSADAGCGSGTGSSPHNSGYYRDERKAIMSLSSRQAGVRSEFVTAQVSNALALVSRSTSA